MLDVAIVLVNDGYASTAIGPIEVFHSAGQMWNELSGTAPEPHFRVSVVSIGGATVTSAYGVRIGAQLSIDAVEHADLILVSSSGLDPGEWMERHQALVPWLKNWHARGAMIAGLCSGVAFLAEAGLLDGRRATTHWAVADSFKRRYPKVDWRTEMLITEDERVFCSGGIYASVDLSLYLVEKLCGHEIAIECSKALLIDMPRMYQSGYAILPIAKPHADQKVRSVEDYLHTNFSRDISVEDLAQQIGMSPRNLIRRFKMATGCLPGAYLQMLRIAAARQMLEEGAPSVQRVGADVGYSDIAFFRQVFRRHTGVTPAEYRSRFKPAGSIRSVAMAESCGDINAATGR